MTRSTNTVNKLLSIQSHVVHGYVGNRAATFPLQVRGWDVDVLNTVQFSNHPAYGSFKGTKSTPEQLKEIYEGLQEIGTDYDAVLTGYIPSDEGLRAVGEICIDICRKRNIKWILDPVLGDNNRIYVSEGNIEIYKEILRSGYVNIVTPNQLELEVLSGVKVSDLKSLKQAITTFAETYSTIEHIVVSSVQFENDQDHLYSAGSSRINSRLSKTFYFKVPTIKASFSGSGDLFSALLASSFFKYSERYEGTVNESTSIERLPLSHSLNEVVSIIEKVLNLTYEYEVEKYRTLGQELPSPLKINDLKLIQAKDFYIGDIENFEPKEF